MDVLNSIFQVIFRSKYMQLHENHARRTICITKYCDQWYHMKIPIAENLFPNAVESLSTGVTTAMSVE